MAQSTTTRATTFILRELIGEVLFFPVWWYTRGLAGTAKSLVHRWYGLLNRLALPILLRNMGKPMYGDYTRSGKVISFFFRLLLVGTRLVILTFSTIAFLIGLLLWLAGPIVCVAMLVRQLFPHG